MERIYTKSDLVEMWKRPLDVQYQVAISKMLEAITNTSGDIKISFSGGKDSCLILDMYCQVVTELLPKYKDKPIEALFANTTNETRNMLEFIKWFIPYEEKKWGVKINLTEVRPKNNMSWAKFVKNNGIPLITKQQAKFIRTIKKDVLSNGCDLKKLYTLYKGGEKAVNEMIDMGFSKSSILHITGYVSSRDHFGKTFFIAKKWIPMVYCPVDLSEQCCVNIKEAPLKKLSGENIITGEQASESITRENAYLRTGCNIRMSDGTYKSKPLGAMTLDGVLYTIKKRNIPICEDYGDIVLGSNGHYHCTKTNRTGCALCGFGCQYDTERFLRVAENEPQKIKFAFKSKENGGAGYSDAIEYMNEYCGTKVAIPK